MKKLLVLAPLMLSACNSGPTVEATNASAREVAEKVAASGAGPTLSPGRWEGTGTITAMEVPGMPPEVAARMKSAMATGHSFANCLTEEEAKKPAASFFSGDKNNCRYDRFSMTGGRIDAKMQCKSDSMIVNTTMVGQFSSDNFQLILTSTSDGMPGQAMTAHKMTIKMDARRTGVCTGKETS